MKGDLNSCLNFITPPTAMAATVLASQAALQEGVLEAGRLEQLAAAAGLRVRRVGSTQADLLVSKAGTSLPFLLWRNAGMSGVDGASPGAIAAAATAASKLASSFRQAYVLLPYELLGNAAVLGAVSRSVKVQMLLTEPLHCLRHMHGLALTLPGARLPSSALSLSLQPWVQGRGTLLCVDADGCILYRAGPGLGPGSAAS